MVEGWWPSVIGTKLISRYRAPTDKTGNDKTGKTALAEGRVRRLGEEAEVVPLLRDEYRRLLLPPGAS